MADIGSAYLSIYPSMTGFASRLTRELGSVDVSSAGSKLGKSLGGGISSSLAGATGSTNVFTSSISALSGVAIGAASAITSSLISAVSSLAGEMVAASDSADKFASTMSFAGIDTSTIEQLIDSTQEYADRTVYDITDIRNVTAQLASNGIENYAQLAEAAGNLNAVAGGSAETFKSVGLAMTQTAGNGKLMADEWNQLVDAIPGASGALQEAMRSAGAFEGNFREAMEQGEISADEFFAAVQQLGMQDVAIQAATSTATIEGAMGNLNAAVVGVGSSLITAFKPSITGTINHITEAVENFGTALDVVIDFGQNWTQKAEQISAQWGGMAKTGDVVSAAIWEIGHQFGFSSEQMAPFTTAIREVINNVGDLASKITGGLSSALGNIGSSAWGAVQSIVGAFGSIGSQVSGQLWTTISGAASTIASGITGVVSTVVDGVSGLFGSVKTAVESAMPTITASVQTVIDNIGAAMPGMVESVSGVIETLRTNIENAFQGISDNIGPFVQTIAENLGTAMTAVSETVGPIVEAVSNIASTVIDGAFSSVSTVVGGIATAFGDVSTAVSGFVQDVAPSFQGIVEGLQPIVQTFMDTVQNLADTFVANLQPIVQTFTTELLPSFSNAFSSISDNMPAIQTTFETVFGAIGNVVGTTFNVLQIGITTGMSVISTVINTVLAAIDGDWSGVWNGIKELFSTIWDGIKGIVETIFPGISDTISGILETIKSVWSNAWETVKSTLSSAWENIKSGVSSGIETVLDFFRNLPQNILNALGDLGSLLLSAGGDIIQGLIDGIKNNIGRVGETIMSGVKGAVNNVLGFLGINSPSRLFRQIGDYTMQGMAIGIDDGVSDVDRAMTYAMDSMYGQAQARSSMLGLSPVSSYAPYGTTRNTTYNVYIDGALVASDSGMQGSLEELLAGARRVSRMGVA